MTRHRPTDETPAVIDGKSRAYGNVRTAATYGCGWALALVAGGLALALIAALYFLIPVLIENTFERLSQLGDWNPYSVVIGLFLIGLGIFVIRPLVNNRLRGQFWVEVPRPGFALAWAVVNLTSGLVFLYFGLRGP